MYNLHNLTRNTDIDAYMRSAQKKSSHCYYNENSLGDIHVTWQPKRVDWNAHVWTMMTLLYQSVEMVDAIEWACVLCGYPFKTTEWIEQRICFKFCIELEHSSAETIWWFRKLQLWATGDWHLHHWKCACSCITSHAEFWGKISNHPGDSGLLQPRFGALLLLDFLKTEITFEREENSDDWWDSRKYNRAADGDWENYVRSQVAYFEGDWSALSYVCLLYTSPSPRDLH